MRTKFMFIRNDKGHPVGCVAYRLEDGFIEFECSTHNPADPFDRKLGRFVAEGRLNKHPKVLSRVVGINEQYDILTFLSVCPGTNERLKKALAQQLTRTPQLKKANRLGLDQEATHKQIPANVTNW